MQPSDWICSSQSLSTCVRSELGASRADMSLGIDKALKSWRSGDEKCSALLLHSDSDRAICAGEPALCARQLSRFPCLFLPGASLFSILMISIVELGFTLLACAILLEFALLLFHCIAALQLLSRDTRRTTPVIAATTHVSVLHKSRIL